MNRLTIAAAVAVTACAIGIPTVAALAAASTHPEVSTGATDANEASPHSGRAERQRRGASWPSL